MPEPAGLAIPRLQALSLWFSPASQPTLMSDTPPDRLCNDPRSKFYDEALLERGIGIRFNGEERTNVEEYCVSEGWVKVPSPKTVDRKGKPLLITLKGAVEVFYR